MRTRTLLILGAITAAAIAGGCSRSTALPESLSPAAVQNIDEAGFARVRERNRGRALMVNFWATWCEPCRDEFPGLVRLDQTYHSQGLSVVAISMDEPESVPSIREFLKQQQAPFGSYRHDFRDFVALVDSIEPRWGGGIPATFLYDRSGKLVHGWVGATRYEDFEREVRPLLR
jgi:thiol-disulfide isomerase/thioredoxin